MTEENLLDDWSSLSSLILNFKVIFIEELDKKFSL